MTPLRIFIGYDPREAVAYHVCANSIIRHARSPVSITPLALNTLNCIYDEAHRDGSNDFIYSRFLVPYLCNFSGAAIFMDGDMLVRDDIYDLLQYLDGDQAVAVVKHDYKTKHPIKYLGNKNEDYPRKNWSSVIAWNCGHIAHRKMIPDYVADMPGSYLHRFGWLDDDAIGELPKAWNWLVDEYEHNDDAKLLHYTIGTPCFKAYASADHAQEWYRELHHLTNVDG
jgi:lipopolysaccharide biosynthesis glycosyltransferase